jgi:hypothetical protein
MAMPSALVTSAAVDQVLGDQVRAGALPAGPSGDSGQADARHQEFDGAVRDDQAAAPGELGVHAAVAVGAARCLVHLPDQVGQQRVPHRPHRRPRPRNS